VIKDVMITDVHTIGPDATIADAARKMTEHKIGCLPVVDGDALVGIVTQSDLVSLLAC
jgi:CBS domain-containing protein